MPDLAPWLGMRGSGTRLPDAATAGEAAGGGARRGPCARGARFVSDPCSFPDRVPSHVQDLGASSARDGVNAH